MNRLASEYDNILLRLKAISNERDELASEFNDVNRELHTVLSDKDQLKIQMNDMDLMHKKLDDEHNNKIINLQMENKTLSSKLQQTESQLNNIQDDKLDLERRVEMEIQKSNSLSKEVDTVHEDLMSYRRLRDREFEDLSNSHAEELYAVNTVLSEITEGKNVAEELVIQLNDEKLNLESEVDDLKHYIMRLEEERSTLIEEVSNLHSVKEQLFTVEQELEKAHDEISTLTPLIDKTISLEEEVISLTKSKAELKKDFEKSQQVTDNLKKEILHSKTAIETLKVQHENSFRQKLEGERDNEALLRQLEKEISGKNNELLRLETIMNEKLKTEIEMKRLLDISNEQKESLRNQTLKLSDRKKELEKICVQWQKVFNKRFTEFSKLHEESLASRKELELLSKQGLSTQDELSKQYERFSSMLNAGLESTKTNIVEEMHNICKNSVHTAVIAATDRFDKKLISHERNKTPVHSTAVIIHESPDRQFVNIHSTDNHQPGDQTLFNHPRRSSPSHAELAAARILPSSPLSPRSHRGLPTPSFCVEIDNACSHITQNSSFAKHERKTMVEIDVGNRKNTHLSPIQSVKMAVPPPRILSPSTQQRSSRHKDAFLSKSPLKNHRSSLNFNHGQISRSLRPSSMSNSPHSNHHDKTNFISFSTREINRVGNIGSTSTTIRVDQTSPVSSPMRTEMPILSRAPPKLINEHILSTSRRSISPSEFSISRRPPKIFSMSFNDNSLDHVSRNKQDVLEHQINQSTTSTEENMGLSAGSAARALINFMENKIDNL